MNTASKILGVMVIVGLFCYYTFMILFFGGLSILTGKQIVSYTFDWVAERKKKRATGFSDGRSPAASTA